MRRTSGLLLLPLLLALALLTGAPSTPVAAAPGATAPTVLKTWTFGHSVKGWPLRAYRIGDPFSTNVAVLIATMHGNEPGPARILKNLLTGPPVHGAAIWVITDLNPDGYLAGTRKNAHGVDLNRNFPIDWVRQTGTYSSGPGPGSEPETKALIALLRAVKPDSVISMHQPLRGVDTSYPKTRPLALRLVKALELPGKTFDCGTGCHGTMTEWFNAAQPGVALTVEYGRPMTDRQVFLTGPRGLLSSLDATR